MASMFAAGLRADALALAFGISERTVHFRLARRGLHYPRPRLPTQKQALATQDRRGVVYLLRGRGLTVAQMAGHLRIQVGTMRAWLRRHVPGLYDQLREEALAQRAARRSACPAAAPTPPPGPQPLTKWRRARIKQAYEAGASLAQIARRYGHHSMTIWRLLRGQGVLMRPRSSRASVPRTHLVASGAPSGATSTS